MPGLFHSCFELELVVCVSEITFGMQNTQGDGLFVISSLGTQCAIQNRAAPPTLKSLVSPCFPLRP